jgi:hypothetical protein
MAEARKRVETEGAERVSCFASAVREQVTEKGLRLDHFASGLEVAQEVGSHFDAWSSLVRGATSTNTNCLSTSKGLAIPRFHTVGPKPASCPHPFVCARKSVHGSLCP